MINVFNHTTITLRDLRATSAAVKGQNQEVKIYPFQGRICVIDLEDYVQGEYQIQFFDSEDQVVFSDTLKVKQHLKYASADYDHRSNNRKILDAITAFLGGVASHQQRRVKVGDKEIEYSSYQQLMKWKDYYQKEVRKEQGKPTKVRSEKLLFRGI